MYIGESKCKQCEEPINAKWDNERKDGYDFDIGKHELVESGLSTDGTMNIKYKCYACETLNKVKLKHVE